jgi:hypothetical protein
MSKVHIASTPVPYTYSLRVLLSVTKGEVKLLKVTRVAMRALAAPSSPPQENSSGFWFEVRDAEGKLLYHRPLPHGDVESVEVFDDPQKGKIRRVPVKDSERKVELIVPDLTTSSQLTVHGPRLAADRMKPSAMLVRYSIENLRKQASGEEPSHGGDQKDSTGGAR